MVFEIVLRLGLTTFKFTYLFNELSFWWSAKAFHHTSLLAFVDPLNFPVLHLIVHMIVHVLDDQQQHLHSCL